MKSAVLPSFWAEYRRLSSAEEIKSQDEELPVSVLNAQQYIGCVEGPGDLSTNKKYMDGYGS